MLKKIYIIIKLIGFDLYLMGKALKGFPNFFRDLIRFLRASDRNSEFNKYSLYPVLSDRYSEAGTGSGQYFHQDLWVAQKIFQNNPSKHVDIGSRVDGFVAHVASYRDIEVFDIRPSPKATDNNIHFIQADLSEPNSKYVHYCESLSCLHALEHFGLGRYGDTVDVFGYLKGFENMYSMLIPGGLFYLSVPIGPQRVEFNAQRVFSIRYLLQLFCDKFTILNFSYIDDAGDMYKEIELNEKLVGNNCRCNNGCGIFILKKL